MSFFKKAATEPKDKKPENPYLNARKTWNDHSLNLVNSRLSWQVIAIISLLIVVLAVAGLIHIASQSKFVPYVVKVDKLGEAVAVAPASRAQPTDKYVVKATLAEFITNARTVTPDVALQRNAIFKLYSHLSKADPATVKMSEWLNGPEGTPFERASKSTVNVQIDSVLQQTDESWQVDWTETKRSRDGEVINRSTMRGLINVYTVPTTSNTTEEQIRNNPLGIYFRDFSWSKQN